MKHGSKLRATVVAAVALMGANAEAQLTSQASSVRMVARVAAVVEMRPASGSGVTAFATGKNEMLVRGTSTGQRVTVPVRIRTNTRAVVLRARGESGSIAVTRATGAQVVSRSFEVNAQPVFGMLQTRPGEDVVAEIELVLPESADGNAFPFEVTISAEPLS